MEFSFGHSFSPSALTLSLRRKLIVFINILKLTFPVNFTIEEKQEIISLKGQNLSYFNTLKKRRENPRCIQAELESEAQDKILLIL